MAEFYLKACPFCGKSASVRYEAKRAYPHDGCFVWVECRVCGSSTKRVYLKRQYEDVKALAQTNYPGFLRLYAVRIVADMWNMRTRSRRKKPDESQAYGSAHAKDASKPWERTEKGNKEEKTLMKKA